jgi:hypothetical protein
VPPLASICVHHQGFDAVGCNICAPSE